MTRDEVLAVLNRRRTAMGRRDSSALAELYADAAKLDSPLAGSVQGKDAIFRSIETFFKAFPDAVVSEDATVIDGERAVVVGEIAGTDVGGFMGLAPSGRAFRFGVAFFLVLQNHQIVRERRIYDFTGLLVQIGVLKAKPA